MSAPVLQIKIIIGGRVVRGELSLADQGVKNNSTLMVVKVRNMIWPSQEQCIYLHNFVLKNIKIFVFKILRTVSIGLKSAPILNPWGLVLANHG